MIKYLCRRSLGHFSQAYNYNVDYLRLILRNSLSAFLRFNLLRLVSAYRVGIPVAPWFAGSILSVLREDCGSCVQLVANMALEAGVDASVLRALVSGKLDELPEEVALAAQFTQLSLSRDPAANNLRPRIVELWGQQGLTSLAFTISASRVYPTLKYVLGYGQTCSRVQIEQQSVVPLNLNMESAIG